jgi:hypothetical protein
MSLLISTRVASLREWLIAASLVPLTLAVAAGVRLDAVATKFATELGTPEIKFEMNDLIDKALAPANGAGKEKIKGLIIASVALVLLGGLVFFLLSIFRTLGGRRGGLEGVGQVLFAIILAIAGLEILK